MKVSTRPSTIQNRSSVEPTPSVQKTDRSSSVGHSGSDSFQNAGGQGVSSSSPSKQGIRRSVIGAKGALGAGPAGQRPGAGNNLSLTTARQVPRATPQASNAVDNEGPGLALDTTGPRNVVSGTDGNDNIQVSAREGGGLVIRNGSETVELTHAQAQNLEIHAKGGDDRVYVSPDVNYNLTIRGGDGNDNLRGGSGNDHIHGGDGRDVIAGANGNDKIYGGAGNDVIAGEGGNDYVEGQGGDDKISGGRGRDVLYGLDGDDVITGGRGRDYIDGGAGDDRLNGGDGIDQIMGGLGDDQLRGGKGNDVLAGGQGRDAYNGDGGADTIFHQSGEWVARDRNDTKTEVDNSGPAPGSSVSVVGDADYQARVQSDLEALRSTPEGRNLLNSLDSTGKSTTIHETTTGNAAGYTHPGARMQQHGNTVNGAGTDTQVDYNREKIDLGGGDAWSERPPIVGLYHELVHAENAGNGSMPTGRTDGDKNRERIAVGLDIDEDNHGGTPRTQPNTNTENKYRRELNLENRDEY